MSISAQIYITNDNATPAVAALMESVEPARLAKICADPLRLFWRARLKNYPRLPGKFASFPDTGFGQAAAESVRAQPGEGTVYLTAGGGDDPNNAIQGLRLRYEGGTIRPVNAKVLCFGITEETYGKSYWTMVAEVMTQKVSLPVQGPTLKGRKTVGRNVVSNRTQNEAMKELRAKFAFAHEITFQPNPALVPDNDEFQEVAMEAIWRRLGPQLAGGNN